MNPRRALTTLFLALAASGPAAAAMRCGAHLITEGDTAVEMRRRCGAPVDVEVRTILRPPVIWRYGRPLHVPGGEIEVRVEYWTYNFGSNQLRRRVRVEDGRVKDIETLGHGYQ